MDRGVVPGESVSPSRWWMHIGRLVALAGLCWIAWVIVSQREALAQLDLRDVLWSLLWGGLLYSAFSFLLPLAWLTLLPRMGVHGRAWGLFSLYCSTQLGKYLPGNVFHFVGRQAAGQWPGLSNASVAYASVLESGLQISAAALLALVALLVSHESLSLASPAVMGAMLAGGAVLPFLLWQGSQFVSKAGWRIEESIGRFYGKVAPALVLYMIFFMGVCLTLLLTVNGLAGETNVVVPASVVFWMYPAIWVAGYVTPGAPGGLGVREAAMVVVLEPYSSAAFAAQLALIFRLITISSDVLLFVVSRFVGRRQP